MANRRRVRSSPVKNTGAADGANGNKKPRKTIDLGWTNKANNKKDGHLDDLIESSSEEEGEDDDDRRRLQQESEEEEETLDAKKIRLARQYLKKLESDDESSGSEEEEEDDDDNQEDVDRLGRKLQRKRMKRQGTLEYSLSKRLAQDVAALHLSSTPSSAIAAAAAAAASTTEMEHDSDVAFQHAKAWQGAGHAQYFRGHDLTPTCVALQQITGEKAISGSKDHSVICWDVETGQKISQLCPAWKPTKGSNSTKTGAATAASRNAGQVLAVACSDDGRYVAVGKRDATVAIFDLRIAAAKQQQSQPLVKTFTGHKGPVTCLAFRTQSRQLFSGSDDRCIRHYNLDEMLYVETLYGHQFGVTDIDCHRQELPVSVGRDRTARVWKLAEDSHLIFRGGAKVASAEAVSVVQDDWFMTGHEDGHLALWMSAKKRPVATIDHAHGLGSASEQLASADSFIGNGITSLAALKNSDVAATGSSDGYVRLWKVSTGKTLAERGMEALANIPVYGYVNGIALGPKAKFCVVAVGQEPRQGRWNRIAKAKNRFGIIRLRSPHDEEEGEDEDDESNQLKSTTIAMHNTKSDDHHGHDEINSDDDDDDDVSADS